MEGKIYKAISDTMSDIGVVGKGSKNKDQGWTFRGIDAVMNALNPAMIKNGIFVTPEILEHTRETRTTNKGATLLYSICKIKYTFYADDGSSVTAVVIGEGMDSGDKATNKAMSIAFKYACFQVFCIPTEEMIDPDTECHEVLNETPNEASNEAPKEASGNREASDKQIDTIKRMCKELDEDYSNVLERNGLSEPISVATASGLIKMLMRKKDARKGQN